MPIWVGGGTPTKHLKSEVRHLHKNLYEMRTSECEFVSCYDKSWSKYGAQPLQVQGMSHSPHPFKLHKKMSSPIQEVPPVKTWRRKSIYWESVAEARW